jgi:hypothetical protein
VRYPGDTWIDSPVPEGRALNPKDETLNSKSGDSPVPEGGGIYLGDGSRCSLEAENQVFIPKP